LQLSPPHPLQLDAARKESEAQRRRVAAIEATAATAMAAAAASSTPFSAGGTGRGRMNERRSREKQASTAVTPRGSSLLHLSQQQRCEEEEDVVDAEVADLLQQLQVRLFVCFLLHSANAMCRW
jgi:hypothetical protein